MSISGNCGLVEIWVTQPPWPSREPFKVMTSWREDVQRLTNAVLCDEAQLYNLSRREYGSFVVREVHRAARMLKSGGIQTNEDIADAVEDVNYAQEIETKMEGQLTVEMKRQSTLDAYMDAMEWGRQCTVGAYMD